MNLAALICEYNPFHNGHRYLLDKIRADGAEAIVVCMSGNFTQRGEPAIFDKYSRTKTALQGGADVVIELPVTFACAGAERFAQGGVFLLNAPGCVQKLYFGCECAELQRLQQAADAADNPQVQSALARKLSKGMTFAKAREEAVAEVYGAETAAILRTPNNILAAEYLKALRRLQSTMQPVPVLRTGVEHDSSCPDGKYASASLIRSLLYSGQDASAYLPPETLSCCQTNTLPVPHDRTQQLESAVLYRLRCMTRKDFARLPDMSEGLENRLYHASRQAVSVKELLALVKCKRYPLARLRRAVMHAFLGITQEDCPAHPAYIRLLGFSAKGREALRLLNTAALPLVTRQADIRQLDSAVQKQLCLEQRCDDLYALSGKSVQPCGQRAFMIK